MISKTNSLHVLTFQMLVRFSASETPSKMLIVVSLLMTPSTKTHLFSEAPKRSRQVLERLILLRGSRLPLIVNILIIQLHIILILTIHTPLRRSPTSQLPTHPAKYAATLLLLILILTLHQLLDVCCPLRLLFMSLQCLRLDLGNL